VFDSRSQNKRVLLGTPWKRYI